MNIHQFLGLPHRFEWGGSGRPRSDGTLPNDCTLFCATWAEMLTGIDPGADLRGTYDSALGAHRILSRAGGIVSFYAGKLEPMGFERVDDKEDGDIAIIEALAGMGAEIRQIGAIAFGPTLWATLAVSGVVARVAEPVAVWRLKNA